MSFGGYVNCSAILAVNGVMGIAMANGIAKSVRMAEGYLNQLAEGNLDIEIDKRLNKRDDELGCMLQLLTILKKRLKESMKDIQTVSEKLMESNEHTNQVIERVNTQIHLTYEAAVKITA